MTPTRYHQQRSTLLVSNDRGSKLKPRHATDPPPADTPARSTAVDAVRIVAIAAIIAGHVWTVGEPHRLLYAWHVPVFFFLTGWLWTPGRPLRVEAVKRAKSLMVPYLSWLVLIGAATAVELAAQRRGVFRLAVDMALGGGKLGRPLTAFWFITALFVACLLRRSLDRVGLPWVTVIAVVLAAVSVTSGPDLARIPESAGMALPALLFIAAGEWARRYARLVRARVTVGALLVLVPLIAVADTRVRVMNMKAGSVGTPVAGYLIALSISGGLLLLAFGLERFAGERVRAVVVTLAAVGVTVVLTHAYVLYLFRTPPSGRWIDFVVALVVPWVCAVLIARTRVARFLVGWR